MIDIEWQARVDTAALYRLIALEGWDDLVGTHVSARIPGEEHRFLLKEQDYWTARLLEV